MIKYSTQLLFPGHSKKKTLLERRIVDTCHKQIYSDMDGNFPLEMIVHPPPEEKSKNYEEKFCVCRI